VKGVPSQQTNHSRHCSSPCPLLPVFTLEISCSRAPEPLCALAFDGSHALALTTSIAPRDGVPSPKSCRKCEDLQALLLFFLPHTCSTCSRQLDPSPALYIASPYLTGHRHYGIPPAAFLEHAITGDTVVPLRSFSGRRYRCSETPICLIMYTLLLFSRCLREGISPSLLSSIFVESGQVGTVSAPAQ
jgi:hypothetical protein